MTPKQMEDSDLRWLPKKPITVEFDLLQYGLHDTGNAERIIAVYGSDMRYCARWKKWLLWDTERWRIDTTQRARKLAKLAMVKSLKQAIERGHKGTEKFAVESLDGKRLRFALSLVEPELAIEPAQLDQSVWLLNFTNGTLDLQNGLLHGHRREDYITKLIPYPLDPEALCPHWLALLNRMMKGNETMVDYLQRAFGYTLTGSTREKAVFILFGPSGTGKTTLLTAFRRVLGSDYATLIQISSLMTGRDSNATQSDLSDLFGARFAMSSEPETGQKLSPGKLKKLTQGTGQIKARRLYEDCFMFEESHHLWIDCNEPPEVPGADGATFARLHAIPCVVQIPDDEVDRELPNRLQEEAPGILAWAVRGTRKWLETGLPRPSEVETATNSWRQQCDHVEQFVEDSCVVGDGFRVQAEKLYAAYRKWAEGVGIQEPVPMTSFGLRMTQTFQKERTNRGNVYLGIGLRV
jgi:putative DNA primase/helicase